MKRIFAAAFLLAGLSAANALEVKQLGGAAPGQAKIEDLAWLEGVWTGEGFGGFIEEAFSAPKDGQIVGYFRSIKDGKPNFMELFTITEEGGSLILRIKHYGGDFTPWEKDAETAGMKLVGIEGQTMYFDGLSYSRTGDSLTGAVLIEQDGTQRVEEFHYTLRSRPAAG